MSEDHIGVKINGVIYVKLDDVKPMRARIEELGAANDKLSCDTLQLYAHIEKLEAALREIVDHAEHRMGHAVSDDVCVIARKALEGKDD